MATHDEVRAAKAHMKEVDNAQEIVLQAMFDDLRNNYETNFDKKEISQDIK